MPDSTTEDPLEDQAGRLLLEAKATLASAESCSGGLIAHRITSVPGSSGYFMGGVVSYSNQAKRDVLGVFSSSIEEHGAVSEEVCREMLKGARERFGANYSVATTGIAGPGGGSEAKPVGLVYIGVSCGEDVENIKRCHFEGDRLRVINQTADVALMMLIELLNTI